MSNVTNTDPVVTEAKLTEFYNDIKPFLGCPAYVTQEGDAEYYSTDEKVIGRWADNKPLYQRTLFISSSYTSEVVIPNTGTGVSVSGITDVFVSDIKPTLDKIINIQMDTNNRYYSGSSFHHSYPFRFNKDNGYVATVDNYNVGYQENIALYPGTSLTFKYTKSTDSAVTTTEQKPTHYSTDEQVVGTWIDGKPVYQKVIQINGLNITDYAGIDLSTYIPNIGDVVEEDHTYYHNNMWAHDYYYIDSNRKSINVYILNGELKAEVIAKGAAVTKVRFIIKYTKATD